MMVVQVNATLKSRGGLQQVVYIGTVDNYFDIFQKMRDDKCPMPEPTNVVAWHIREVDEAIVRWMMRPQQTNTWYAPETNGMDIK